MLSIAEAWANNNPYLNYLTKGTGHHSTFYSFLLCKFFDLHQTPETWLASMSLPEVLNLAFVPSTKQL